MFPPAGSHQCVTVSGGGHVTQGEEGAAALHGGTVQNETLRWQRVMGR